MCGRCSSAIKVTDCPNENPVARCNAECEDTLAWIGCAAASPYFTCLENLGASAYDCTSSGVRLRADACASERQAAEQCATDGGCSGSPTFPR
jgi:hypothetical protein